VPTQRLEPSSTVAAEFTGIGFTGHATPHQALADDSDSSYVTLQVTSSEPTKWWRGELTNLPDGAGVVTGTVINVRADRAVVQPADFVHLRCGDYPNVRLSNVVTDTITDYATSSLTDLDVSECNAAQWMAGCDWDSGVGHTVNIYKMNFDVDFNYISGVSVAMIFQLLGPLVAVGLHEMPGLRMELWRKGRLWLHRHEVPQVFRDMREARHRLVLA
jgi:hypothetical protein